MVHKNDVKALSTLDIVAMYENRLYGLLMRPTLPKANIDLGFRCILIIHANYNPALKRLYAGQFQMQLQIRHYYLALFAKVHVQ